MSSSGDHPTNRRSTDQRQRKGQQPKTPLFPLEADDIAPRSRRLPPAPLEPLLGDIDAVLPTKAIPPGSLRGSEERLGSARGSEERHQHAVPGNTLPWHWEPILPQAGSGSPTRLRLQAAAPQELDHAHKQLKTTRGVLAQAEQLLTQQRPLERRSQGGASRQHSWIIVTLLVGAILLLVPLLLIRSGDTELSAWRTFQSNAAIAPIGAYEPLVGTARPEGDYTLRSAPSLTPDQIDRILATYGSPAAGTGQVWYDLGRQYGIDPAFALAFFISESTAGTAKMWAGRKPDGTTTHNIGNIICAGYPTCYGRFRDYPSWEAGIADWYRLIDVEYLRGRGHKTLADVLPVYAPATENDVNGYMRLVQRLVDQWRTSGAP